MPDQYTAHVWTEAESAEKKLRIEKYPDYVTSVLKRRVGHRARVKVRLRVGLGVGIFFLIRQQLLRDFEDFARRNETKIHLSRAG